MTATDAAAMPDADGAGRGGLARADQPRGKRPQRPRTKFRRVDGILLLDKPGGMSSNQALQRARHLFGAEKGGHTGALDPLATGLLPLCFGEATKIAGSLLGSAKAYDTVARLGQVTDTDDAEGQVLRERPVQAYPIDRLDAALRALTGHLQQRPPIYSALKRGGEPLYAKARRGEVVEVETRPVYVRAFELQSAADLLDAGQPLLRLHVECGSGTYVRSLVRDLGEALGCGAHVAQLRRLWVDPFREPRMWTLEQLEALAERDPRSLQACLLPVEAGMVGLPRIDLTDEAAARLRQGQRLTGVPGPAGTVAVFAESGQVLGMGQLSKDGLLSPQRLFNWPTDGAVSPA
ncbi:tRNA pseudouridine(55) synthase TruB [Pseudoxanthomonas winnipegensis]|uniref:tRNA pseudouridine synthase B n=1 Tax=Pseudoxanthomonas winnipegensis TaxID=2480810 RepID=A0A4Q8LXV3_9GAMM|nr:tRNA pseudouridine(55) synthase TruB [Pseudoxanthomonas winnipegensis]RZZ90562.1 tRNA pseudouridine(55) synthase TruB [Pseudoxanthomonas winnipegensis]TAA37282.1 tRNA pseudouridine(55) synthase TruB [Pseudoxanthomonas winnipegensis]